LFRGGPCAGLARHSVCRLVPLLPVAEKEGPQCGGVLRRDVRGITVQLGRGATERREVTTLPGRRVEHAGERPPVTSKINARAGFRVENPLVAVELFEFREIVIFGTNLEYDLENGKPEFSSMVGKSFR